MKGVDVIPYIVCCLLRPGGCTLRPGRVPISTTHREVWGWYMDVLLAEDQGPKKRVRKRGEGIGEFQVQDELTELMSQVGFEDTVTECSSMRIRLS